MAYRRTYRRRSFRGRPGRRRPLFGRRYRVRGRIRSRRRAAPLKRRIGFRM